MAFVSTLVASDLFTGITQMEPLRITSTEIQERYQAAIGDRVKVAKICRDVLDAFNPLLRIEGIELDRENIAYVILAGPPKAKSQAYVMVGLLNNPMRTDRSLSFPHFSYVYSASLGYSAYVPFPDEYFQQKFELLASRATAPPVSSRATALPVPSPEHSSFKLRNDLCSRVPGPYKWDTDTEERHLLSYITPGSDGNLADRTYENTEEFLKKVLGENHQRYTVKRAGMTFNKTASKKPKPKHFVMPYNATELGGTRPLARKRRGW